MIYSKKKEKMKNSVRIFVQVAVIFILMLLLLCAIFRNLIFKRTLLDFASKVTELELSIEDLDLDLLRSKLFLQEITLHNPPGFEQETLAKVDEITLHYNLAKLLFGELYFHEIKANISEINIVRTSQGISNVSSIKRKFDEKKKAQIPKVTSQSKEDSKPKKKTKSSFFIERLEISLKKASFVDYKAGVGKPATIIFTLKGPSVFTDVSDLNYVVDSVSKKGGFQNILNLLGVVPQDFIKNTSEVFSDALKKKIEEQTPQ